MKTWTVMGRTFETDDNKMLLDAEGNSTKYRLGDCFLKHDRSQGKTAFNDTRPDDHVIFYGTDVVGMDMTKVHTDYLLIRDRRVVEICRPYDGMIID